MNAWLVATILLVPPLALAVGVAMRADVNSQLSAVQLAGSLTALMLAAMTFVFDQSSFIDLALGLALLSVPGTYLTSLFMERWL